MKWFITWLFLLVGLPLFAQPVRVAVAANAQFVIEKLRIKFERQTGVRLETIVNSSGKLTAQIQQGAPFDIFLSADTTYPAVLFRAGLTVTRPRVYAYGLLVIWTRKNINLGIGMTVLKEAGVRKIAMANPRIAPYGMVAMAVLQKRKLLDLVRPKIVYGESISQVNQYLVSGVVDAGFTAKSAMFEPSLRDKGHWIEVIGIPPIAQGVVLLKSDRQTQHRGAKQFYDFLFSPPARAIFERYGYRLPATLFPHS